MQGMRSLSIDSRCHSQQSSACARVRPQSLASHSGMAKVSVIADCRMHQLMASHVMWLAAPVPKLCRSWRGVVQLLHSIDSSAVHTHATSLRIAIYVRMRVHEWLGPKRKRLQLFSLLLPSVCNCLSFFLSFSDLFQLFSDRRASLLVNHGIFCKCCSCSYNFRDTTQACTTREENFSECRCSTTVPVI